MMKMLDRESRYADCAHTGSVCSCLFGSEGWGEYQGNNVKCWR